MAENLVKVIVNCETGEVQELPFTAEELAQREADAAFSAALDAQREAEAQTLANLKASAKAKLIAGKPLTAEEADTLIL